MIEHSVLVLEFFHDAFIEGVFGNDVVVKTGLVLSNPVRSAMGNKMSVLPFLLDKQKKHLPVLALEK